VPPYVLLAFHHPPPKPDSVVYESGFFILTIYRLVGNMGLCKGKRFMINWISDKNIFKFCLTCCFVNVKLCSYPGRLYLKGGRCWYLAGLFFLLVALLWFVDLASEIRTRKSATLCWVLSAVIIGPKFLAENYEF